MASAVIVKTRKFSVLEPPGAPSHRIEALPAWSAAAPSSHVSEVLAQSAAAAESRRVGDWEEYVDPETKHTYWYNAVEDVSSWEAPGDDGEADVAAKADTNLTTESLVLEVGLLRDVQHKLIKIVAALHQRLGMLSERDQEKDDRITALTHRVADLDRDLAVNHAVGVPPAPAKEVLDAFLAEAIEAEHRRFFAKGTPA